MSEAPERILTVANGLISGHWNARTDNDPHPLETEYVREDLVRTIEDAGDDYRLSAATRAEWAERALKAEAERDRLRKAVGPFAALLKPHHDDLEASTPIFGIEGSVISVGDLREAIRAMKKE